MVLHKHNKIKGWYFNQPFILSPIFLTTHDSRLRIFPNPAKDIITIESNNIQQIKMVDNTGRKVIDNKLETITSNTKIDVSGLTKGLYLIQVINTNGETKTEKLIVQ